MYKIVALVEDTVVVDWTALPVRGMRPEVRYKAGEQISVRVAVAGDSKVYTAFHVGLDGTVYTNSRMVDKNGKITKCFNSRQMQSLIVQDMNWTI